MPPRQIIAPKVKVVYPLPDIRKPLTEFEAAAARERARNTAAKGCLN